MSYNPLDIESQQETAAAAKTDASTAAATHISDVAWVMSSRRGRRFMNTLMRASHQSVFSTNALTMAHTEGMRAQARELYSKVMLACPELYLQMLKESADG